MEFCYTSMETNCSSRMSSVSKGSTNELVAGMKSFSHLDQWIGSERMDVCHREEFSQKTATVCRFRRYSSLENNMIETGSALKKDGELDEFQKTMKKFCCNGTLMISVTPFSPLAKHFTTSGNSSGKKTAESCKSKSRRSFNAVVLNVFVVVHHQIWPIK